MIHKVPSEEVARLETLEGITVLKQPGVGQRLFRFGCNDEIMSNTKVRQALNYAVDRDAIRKALFADVSEETITVRSNRILKRQRPCWPRPVIRTALIQKLSPPPSMTKAPSLRR